MKEKINFYLNKYNISLSEEKVNKLNLLIDCVLEKNKVMNLTAITETEDFIVKHILDSLIALPIITDNSYILDIGSGGGFPALPLNIANTTLKFTLIDSAMKKTIFLKKVISDLNIKDARVYHKRIEDLDNEYKETFDYVTCRAVADLSILIEYSLPFLKINGKMIAYKGPNFNEELERAENSLKLLGGEVNNIFHFDLEGNNRNLIVIKKVKKCDKIYPRKLNLPRIKPL